MRGLKVTGLVFALALCSAAVGHGTASRADPVLTQGVGIANCGKLANDRALYPTVQDHDVRSVRGPFVMFGSCGDAWN